MNILVVTSFYPPFSIGGYELRCKSVVDHLIKKGHKVQVIVGKHQESNSIKFPNNDYIFRKLHISKPNAPKLRMLFEDFLDLSFLEKVINNQKPDLIYLWQLSSLSKVIIPYFSDLDILIIFDEGGASLINAWEHKGSWYSFISAESSSRILNTLKKTISVLITIATNGKFKKSWCWPIKNKIYFNSELGKNNALKKNIPVELSPVIYSGIDTNLFKFSSQKNQSSQITIVMTGRIEPSKNQIEGFFLLEFLLRQNYNIIINCIGINTSEPYMKEINNHLSINKDLQNRINFIPRLNQMELATHYQKSNFLFFPSLAKTGFSRTILEAMACGCAVISYGNEGSDEIIKHGENGFLVNAGDFSAIEAIIGEMNNNPKKYSSVLLKGRKTVEQYYSLKSYLTKIETYILN